MVRRLKEDIRATQGGLPERRVERVVIDGLSPDAPELQLSRLLDECRTAREERHAHTSNKGPGGRRPARRGPPATAAVVGRGVRAQSGGPSADRRTPLGAGAGGQRRREGARSARRYGAGKRTGIARAGQRRDTPPLPDAARGRRRAWRAGGRSHRGRGRSPDRGDHRGRGILVDVGSRQGARGAVAAGAAVARPDAGDR